jgi:hypothetical protein
MGFPFNDQSYFTNGYLTVKTTAKISGYNQQYLKRLLGGDVFRSKRLGQIWLIDLDDFLRYLHNARRSEDKRFVPN